MKNRKQPRIKNDYDYQLTQHAIDLANALLKKQSVEEHIVYQQTKLSEAQLKLEKLQGAYAESLKVQLVLITYSTSIEQQNKLNTELTGINNDISNLCKEIYETNEIISACAAVIENAKRHQQMINDKIDHLQGLELNYDSSNMSTTNNNTVETQELLEEPTLIPGINESTLISFTTKKPLTEEEIKNITWINPKEPLLKRIGYLDDDTAHKVGSYRKYLDDHLLVYSKPNKNNQIVFVPLEKYDTKNMIENKYVMTKSKYEESFNKKRRKIIKDNVLNILSDNNAGPNEDHKEISDSSASQKGSVNKPIHDDDAGRRLIYKPDIKGDISYVKSEDIPRIKTTHNGNRKKLDGQTVIFLRSYNNVMHKLRKKKSDKDRLDALIQSKQTEDLNKDLASQTENTNTPIKNTDSNDDTLNAQEIATMQAVINSIPEDVMNNLCLNFNNTESSETAELSVNNNYYVDAVQGDDETVNVSEDLNTIGDETTGLLSFEQLIEYGALEFSAEDDASIANSDSFGNKDNVTPLNNLDINYVSTHSTLFAYNDESTWPNNVALTNKPHSDFNPRK